jgi:hypothetical protein
MSAFTQPPAEGATIPSAFMPQNTKEPSANSGENSQQNGGSRIQSKNDAIARALAKVDGKAAEKPTEPTPEASKPDDGEQQADKQDDAAEGTSGDDAENNEDKGGDEVFSRKFGELAKRDRQLRSAREQFEQERADWNRRTGGLEERVNDFNEGMKTDPLGTLEKYYPKEFDFEKLAAAYLDRDERPETREIRKVQREMQEMKDKEAQRAQQQNIANYQADIIKEASQGGAETALFNAVKDQPWVSQQAWNVAQEYVNKTGKVPTPKTVAKLTNDLLSELKKALNGVSDIHSDSGGSEQRSAKRDEADGSRGQAKEPSKLPKEPSSSHVRKGSKEDALRRLTEKYTIVSR